MARHEQHEQATLIIVDNSGWIRLRLADRDSIDYLLPVGTLIRPALSTIEAIIEWIDDCEQASAEDWDEDYIVARWTDNHWKVYPDTSSHSARLICGLVG